MTKVIVNTPKSIRIIAKNGPPGPTGNTGPAGNDANVFAHEQAANPHPQYILTTNADARFANISHDHNGVYETVGVANNLITIEAIARANGDNNVLVLSSDYTNAQMNIILGGTPLSALNTIVKIANRIQTNENTAANLAITVAADISNLSLHIANSDPHSQYINVSRGDARYANLTHNHENLYELVGSANSSNTYANTLFTLEANLRNNAIMGTYPPFLLGPLSILKGGPIVYAAGAASVMVANRLYLSRTYASVTQTITELGLRVITGAANTKCRLGIYNSKADGTPGTKLLDAGEIPTDSTGYVSIAIANGQVLQASTIYWLAAVFNGTPTVSGFTNSTAVGAILGWDSTAATSSARTAMYRAKTYDVLDADEGSSSWLLAAVTIPLVFYDT